MSTSFPKEKDTRALALAFPPSPTFSFSIFSLFSMCDLRQSCLHFHAFGTLFLCVLLLSFLILLYFVFLSIHSNMTTPSAKYKKVGVFWSPDLGKKLNLPGGSQSH